MSRLRALAALAEALRGAPDPHADWMAVLEIANQALVTPQIHAAAERAGSLERLPPDVRTFTGDVHRRNRERNRRLFGQLRDALLALNAAGIEPVLLKGAALWASLGRPEVFDRMMNDLDLLVAPAEARRAVNALTGAGFDLDAEHPGADVHVVAELGRPSDVGFIDLHQRPPGPPGLAELPGLERRCRLVEWDGVRARVPDPAAQVFFLVLHDQFHEGAYWRGGFSLRHLADIAALSRGPEAIDWTALAELSRTRLVANAVAAQAVAAARFAGADVPRAIRRRPWARLQHARHAAQFAWPVLALPLAGLAVLSEAPSLIAHRRADAAARRRMFEPETARRPLAHRLARLRELLGGPAPGRV